MMKTVKMCLVGFWMLGLGVSWAEESWAEESWAQAPGAQASGAQGGKANRLLEQDRYVGYYYPPIGSREAYHLKIREFSEASKRTRLAFVASVVHGLDKRGVLSDFIMFAKGQESDKLIIMALEDDRLNTLYRLRGHMAGLTSRTRLSRFFKDIPTDNLTFLDLVGSLGFKIVTITDGQSITHQYTIVRQ